MLDIDTPFHINFKWWEQHGRNLGRLLAEILGEDEEGAADATEATGPVDYIDPETGEVFGMNPLWVQVLIQRAHKPGYISPSTPLTSAVVRALVENMNRPMSARDLHRRINRSNPQTLLRVLRTARAQYGVSPLLDGADGS